MKEWFEFWVSEEFCTRLSSDEEKSASASAVELDEVRQRLSNFGFVVMRSVKSRIPIKKIMDVLDARVFEDDFGRKDILLNASPFETSNAETLLEGVFHTDFSTMLTPPDYISIECVRPDNRHPYFGRNQIANLAVLMRKLQEIDSDLPSKFAHTLFPFKMRDGLYWNYALHRDAMSGPYIKYHPGYILHQYLTDVHYYRGIALHRLIEEVALDISYDFCLDQNDVLLASNKRCLHRRGRATANFGGHINQSYGRVVNTVRYISN